MQYGNDLYCCIPSTYLLGYTPHLISATINFVYTAVAALILGITLINTVVFNQVNIYIKTHLIAIASSFLFLAISQKMDIKFI